MTKLVTVKLCGDNPPQGHAWMATYENVVPTSISRGRDGWLAFSTKEKQVETNLRYVIEIPNES